MTSKPASDPTARATPADGSAPRGDVYAALADLARKSAAPAPFLAGVLRVLGRHFNSPYAAIHVRYAAEVVQDDWHTGSTDPAFWKAGLQQFLTESLVENTSRAKLLRGKRDGTTVAFLATPVLSPTGQSIGSIAMVVGPLAQEDIRCRLLALESLARFASYTAGFLDDTGKSDALGGRHGGSASRGSPGQALARAARFRTPVELAFALTNDLCNRMGCEQVALGLVAGRRVRVLSISGLDTVRHQSPGVVHLRGAMEECLDAAEALVFQRGDGWASEQVSTGHRLHKQWHAAVQGDAVASLPLFLDGAPFAILSMRRRADQPFKSTELHETRARVEPLMPALHLTRQASRNLLQHAADGIRAGVATLTQPGRWMTRLLTALALVGLWTFLFGTLNYQLTVPCVVTPNQLRHTAVPFDAVIASAAVIEGDRVAQGDVLCEMDHRDLDQQRAELLAELAVGERAIDRARAQDEPVEVQLAQANRELTRAKLDIINRRIEQATVRAPIDGVIVSGDLRKRIGSVVTRGEPLFAIAPLTGWTLELAVPEAASADLAPNLSGYFASYARPDRTRAFRIDRIHAEAQTRHEKNVYIAEADIDAADAWLRPGMEGVAKVRVGQKRIWWITLHRAIDYLRLHLWL